MVSQNLEKYLTMASLIFLGFILVNVSSTLGAIYVFFALTYYIGLGSGIIKEINIFGNKFKFDNLSSNVAISVLAWICISFVMFNFLLPNFTFSVENLMSQFSAGGLEWIINSSTQMRIIVYGVAVPIFESMFFLSFVLLFVAGIFGVSVYQNWKDKKALWVSAVVGAIASVFHLLTRTSAINPDYALIIDFAFFTLSAIMVFKFKRLAEPMALHMAMNTLAVLYV